MQKRKEYKEAKVNEMNGNVGSSEVQACDSCSYHHYDHFQLFMLRKALCGSLFSIFPVSEVIAHSVRADSSNARNDGNAAG